MPPTVHAAARQIRDNSLSPVDLLESCLARVDALDGQVRAWVLLDRDGARARAERCADEVRRGQWRGPLHGIPVGVKDIIDVFDWPTAAGSRLWQRSVARQDAPVVERLRRAGAVLLGKTVTTQYASFDPPPTRNPWGPGRTPGGSSSGSAAAVACGMCLAALGSQTGGSITRPASYCGVVGCKPTFGRVSTRGVLPLAESMDHVGTIARCVRDCAILLQAVADPPVPNWLAELEGERRPPRLGRLRGLFEERAEPSVREMMDAVSDTLRRRGATITEVALPAAFAEVIERHRVVMAVEAAAFHQERLRRHPEDYGPCIRGLLEEGLACPAPEYARCKAHLQQLREQVRACLEGLDALLTPATTGPAPDSSTTGDPAFNSPWSYTGLPTVSLPAAWGPGHLPLAIQLVGRPWAEGEVLSAAAWCEQAVGFEAGDPPGARG